MYLCVSVLYNIFLQIDTFMYNFHFDRIMFDIGTRFYLFIYLF
jgi:hypothetical protein